MHFANGLAPSGIVAKEAIDFQNLRYDGPSLNGNALTLNAMPNPRRFLLGCRNEHRTKRCGKDAAAPWSEPAAGGDITISCATFQQADWHIHRHDPRSDRVGEEILKGFDTSTTDGCFRGSPRRRDPTTRTSIDSNDVAHRSVVIHWPPRRICSAWRIQT